MTEGDSESPKKPRRRFWKKKRWWILLVLVAGLGWFDGPGWKWIAHLVADRFLPRLGYQVSFTLEGRLTSGSLGISQLQVTSESTLQSATLDRLEIGYSLRRVVRGEIQSIDLTGLHADVDLAASVPSPETGEPEKANQPTDPVELLARLRQRLVPMNLQIRKLSVTIRRGDDPVFLLEPTSILHDPASNAFILDLGAMELPGERTLSAQTTRIDWHPDRLVLDRLKLLEELAITSLEAEIAKPLRFRTGLEIADDRLELTTDLDEATLTLTEGTLTAGEIQRLAEIELPIEATVSALVLSARQLSGGLETLTAEISLTLDRFDYDGWHGQELRLDASLDEAGKATASLRGTAIGSPLTLNLETALDRTDSLLPLTAKARLEIPRAQSALAHVRDRYLPDPEAPPQPATALLLDAETTFIAGVPADARARLALPGGDGTPPLALDARWIENRTAEATVRIPGLEIDGRFETDRLRYSGRAALDRFTPDSLAPWSAPWGTELPPGITASLAWEGSGDLRQQVHTGTLDLTGAEWQRTPEQPTLTATAKGRYAWPETFNLEALEVRQGPLQIATALDFADQVISLSKLSLTENAETLATGTARIPVPEDLSDWKALLRESRPIEVDLKTPELALAKLHPFLPENIRFPDASRGQIEIDLAGTPAAPELKARIRAMDLRLESQPDIPAANLEIDALGKDQTLKIDGTIRTENFPPAELQLLTNWDPDQWAADPATVQEAKLDAELTIANLNLASLATFLPEARTLAGRLDLRARVGGTVAAPEPQATLTLAEGALRLKDSKLPPISRGTINLTATPGQVALETLSAEVSGGTLQVSGTLGLDAWKPGTLDLRLAADSLPAVRDEAMIVRLSADLDLRGPWESARLGGEIRVVDSLFFKDIELLPIGEPMTSVAEPSLPSIDAPPPADATGRIPQPFAGWGLDLSLKTEAPFLIRGNLASGEIYLDARVGGTLANPRPSGGAKLREIIAQLPFSTLEIKSGEIKFRPDHPFDPVLDFRGTSRIRPYEITVYVYGPVSDPKIQPTSSPPLPETEVMTLIATGTTTAGLEDPAAATARATQLLIEEARRGRIGAVRAFRPVFRVLDKLDFQVGETDAYTSRKFNSVSFDLDENWILSAGISEQGNTRTKVTYLFRFR